MSALLWYPLPLIEYVVPLLESFSASLSRTLNPYFCARLQNITFASMLDELGPLSANKGLLTILCTSALRLPESRSTAADTVSDLLSLQRLQSNSFGCTTAHINLSFSLPCERWVRVWRALRETFTHATDASLLSLLSCESMIEG